MKVYLVTHSRDDPITVGTFSAKEMALKCYDLMHPDSSRNIEELEVDEPSIIKLVNDGFKTWHITEKDDGSLIAEIDRHSGFEENEWHNALDEWRCRVLARTESEALALAKEKR